jgi:hypothetical protein
MGTWKNLAKMEGDNEIDRRYTVYKVIRNDDNWLVNDDEKGQGRKLWYGCKLGSDRVLL